MQSSMHFVGTSLLGTNTRALHRPLNQVAGVDIDDAKLGSSRMSVVALRNCGSLLRSRNGSLEQAFHVLDAEQAGQLTLEAFTRGMEQFGSSPEDARSLFQQMDVSGTGYVTLPAFLAALRDESELLPQRSPRLEESQEIAGRLSRIEAQLRFTQTCNEDNLEMAGRLTRLEAQVNEVATNRGALQQLEAQVADMKGNRWMSERLTRLEAQSSERPETKGLSDEVEALRKALFDERMARDAQDQALIAELESMKLQSAAQVRMISQGASSAVISELQAKLEVLRVQLEARVEDLVATQVQGELASLRRSAEATIKRAEGLEQRCQAQVTTQQDALRQRLESHMQDMRAEWRAEVQSESVANATKNRELERSIVERAVAEAGSTVLSMTKDLFNKEEGDHLRIEATQYAERLAVAEDHLKMLRMEVDRIRTLCSSGIGSQGTTSVRVGGVEAKDVDSAEAASFDARISETAVRLESRIMSVSQNVQKVSTSMRAEVGDLRAELRRLSSVDIHNLVGNVAKLQIESDEDRKQVVQADTLAKQASEVWQKETELRALEDKRLEGKFVEQLGSEVGSLLVKIDALKDDMKAQAMTISDLAKGIAASKKLGPGTSARRTPIPSVLQERLETIIKKMDSKCIEDLAPDLRQLSVLLSEEEQAISQVASSEHETSSTPSVPTRSDDLSSKGTAERLPPQSPPPSGKGTRGSGGQAAFQSQFPQSMRGSTSTNFNTAGLVQRQSSAEPPRVDGQAADDETRGDDHESAGAMRRLREDILSYLHVEFQEMLSTTLKKSWPSQSQGMEIGPTEASSLSASIRDVPYGLPQRGGSLKVSPKLNTPRDVRGAPSFPNSAMGGMRPTSQPRMVNQVPVSGNGSRDQSINRDSLHNVYAQHNLHPSSSSANYPGGSMELPRGSMPPASMELPRGSMELPLAPQASPRPSQGHPRTHSPNTAGAKSSQPSISPYSPRTIGATLTSTPSTVTPSTMTPSAVTPTPPFNRRSASPKSRLGPTPPSSLPGTRAPSASSTATQWRSLSSGLPTGGGLLRN